MNTENVSNEPKGNKLNPVLANVIVGMVLVPKPEHAHKFKEGKQYVVTQNDIDAGNPVIGEYWIVKS